VAQEQSHDRALAIRLLSDAMCKVERGVRVTAAETWCGGKIERVVVALFIVWV
jgi:hypothetical protein